jgi:ankyrin repeat protein
MPNRKGYRSPKQLREKALKDRFQIIKLLIEHGANVNAQDIDGNTPLHAHAMATPLNHEIVQYLLANGADREIKNNAGNTALELLDKRTDYEVPTGGW